MTNTSNLNLMSNLKINDKSFIIKDVSRIEFPNDPNLGLECFVNGVNYIYAMQDGELGWIPTSVTRKQYKYVLNEASVNWRIDHNLDTKISDLVVIVYNALNEVIYGTITEIDNNSFTITFSEAVTGKVSVFQTGGDGGTTGKDGLSAYELYIETVPEGETVLTIEEWLESLKGENGVNGLPGIDGIDGINGKSAYELYVETVSENETTLTLEEWLESLKGPAGNNVDLSGYYNKTQVDSLIDTIPETDLSEYYKKTETYSKVEVDTMVGDIASALDTINGEVI